MELAGKLVVVVGMARSGIAAARLLQEKGAQVRAVDEHPNSEATGLPVEPQTAAAFEDCDLVVLSPGVPADLALLEPVRARRIPVIGELELASWFLQGPTIGITGANGKTTTTALTGHILTASNIACQVGGNIGTPAAAMVETSLPDQWNVLELSSFQLETIEKFHARISAALNITPDHLDRHHTFENYVNAKARLFETQVPGDFAVLNADDPVCVALADRTPATPVWFSSTRTLPSGLWVEEGQVLYDGEPLMRTGEVPLRGRHNLENVMAAAAAAHLAGALLPQISAAVCTFPGVEHRLQLVRELRGVAYYNDSKATNVDATLKAVAAFDGGLWIILGGKDKDSDYRPLRNPLREKARGVLLIGSAAKIIASQLDGAAPLIHCGDLATAVQLAYDAARPRETVLLAPACASFDQFQNFEHRGRVFTDLVRGLASRVQHPFRGGRRN
ncbi:MAG: UDP-N-acetylmuramoyl-L-alanine--D-glutamate ligase [Acidobacteriota bacterium]|nr:UDP-N-acetylmuramoyl-L-alanine--D-glutamate ligase [Acidobacteriota bacterium]